MCHLRTELILAYTNILSRLETYHRCRTILSFAFVSKLIVHNFEILANFSEI